MAQGWTKDQDELLMHMFVQGFNTSDMAKALGKSRTTIYDRVRSLKNQGWDGHSDPRAGQPNPKGFEPPKSSRFRRATAWAGNRFLDHNIKKDSMLYKVLSRRFRGDRIDGENKKDSIAGAVDALNDHHRLVMRELGTLNATLARGTAASSRAISSMGEKISLSIERMTRMLDKDAFGPTTVQSPAQHAVAANMTDLKGGKGMLGKLGLLGLGGMLGLGATALGGSKAEASVNPNDRIDPFLDKPKPEASDTEQKLRDESEKNRKDAIRDIQMLEIKGQDLTFKGQSITFEADEFDVKALFGAGKRDGVKGFQDGVAPPPPPGAERSGSGAGAGPDVDGTGTAPAGQGNTSGENGSQGGIMDRLKSMLGIGSKGTGKGGGGGGSGGGGQDNGPPEAPENAGKAYDKSSGFVPMPKGQKLPDIPPASRNGPSSDAGGTGGPGAGGTAGNMATGGDPSQAIQNDSSGDFASRLAKQMRGGAGTPQSRIDDAFSALEGGKSESKVAGGPATGKNFTTKDAIGDLGLNSDKFTPDTKPGYGRTAALAEERAEIMKHLDSNPELKEKLFAVAANEQGTNSKGVQAVMEETINRAMVRGGSVQGAINRLEKETRFTSEGGYYDDSHGSQGRAYSAARNPKNAKMFNDAFEGVRAGSDISNNAYGNASGGLAARKAANGAAVPTTTINGETFFGPNSDEPKYLKNYADRNNRLAARAKQLESNFAGPGAPNTGPQDVKIKPNDPAVKDIPGGFSPTPMKQQKLLQDNVVPPPTPGKMERLYVGPNRDNQSEIKDNLNNQDFLNRSEKSQVDQMNLSKPVVNDTGGVTSGSSGRDPSNLRSDLQDTDETEMQTSMNDHFNGGDFPGLGDQSNSDSDTGFA